MLEFKALSQDWSVSNVIRNSLFLKMQLAFWADEIAGITPI